jgi:chemotaxis protein CheX
MSTAAEEQHELMREIIDMVWESLLQAEAVPWFGPEPVEATAVRAQVTLSGDWNGAIRLSCDGETAERIAGSMLSLTAGAHLPREDVYDAIGEVVNVVGGNVKGALGGTTSLGLPTILDGPPDAAFNPSSRHLVDWHGAPVVVEVVATQAEHVPDPETGEPR